MEAAAALVSPSYEELIQGLVERFHPPQALLRLTSIKQVSASSRSCIKIVMAFPDNKMKFAFPQSTSSKI